MNARIIAPIAFLHQSFYKNVHCMRVPLKNMQSCVRCLLSHIVKQTFDRNI